MTPDFHDQLIRGIVHKLNNILSLVHGYGGMLVEDKNLDEQTRETVSRMLEGADLGTALSERLALLMRPSSLVWKETPLNEMLLRMHQSLSVLSENGPAVEVQLPTELPTLWTDPRLLRIVLEELVHNAAQAGGKAPVIRIEVEEPGTEAQRHQRGTKAEQRLHLIEIRVIDHGDGIPPERAEKIFTPFYSTRTHQSAMGLGLPIALRLTECLGGRLSFTSEPGKTVFSLRLPMRASAA